MALTQCLAGRRLRFQAGIVADTGPFRLKIIRRNHPGQIPAQSTLALLFARGDDDRMRAGNGVVLRTMSFLVQEIAERERERKKRYGVLPPDLVKKQTHKIVR